MRFLLGLVGEILAAVDIGLHRLGLVLGRHDDVGRVSYASRTYPTSTVDLVSYSYGGVGVEVQKYYLYSTVRRVKAYPGTSGWDVGFDRFTRPYQSYWFDAQTYAQQRISYDDNSNITAVENVWNTPWSATYESDGLNRLKGLDFGVMTSGSISTVVQTEDWQTGGSLKLDQVGNWIDYKRVREGVTQDDFQGNDFTDINTYETFEEGGSTKWKPQYDAKGLPAKDDKLATAKGYYYVFDAWDRLVTVNKPTGGIVQEFRYNGLGHRIARHYDTTSGGLPPAPDGIVDSNDPWDYFQYNERWQQVAFWEGAKTNATEVFTYGQAGLDGYGGSSHIDDIVCRERDKTANGSYDDLYFYLQNWRHDVVAIMNYDGAILERIVYDAYGRPHSFSPGDLKGGGGSGNDRPDGVLDASDTWTTGTAAWNKDIGTAGGLAIPDGTVSGTDEPATLVALKVTGHTGGWNLLSDTDIGNRKGLAGYEFDPVLNGAGGVNNKTFYHVRHRVLASDTGKWMQKDPLGYHDGMDLYEYCQSDAVDGVDAMGLTCSAYFTSSCSGHPKTGGLTCTQNKLRTVTFSPDPLLRQRLECESWCKESKEIADAECDRLYPFYSENRSCKIRADQCWQNCKALCNNAWVPFPMANCLDDGIGPWDMPDRIIPAGLPSYDLQMCRALAYETYQTRIDAYTLAYEMCMITPPRPPAPSCQEEFEKSKKRALKNLGFDLADCDEKNGQSSRVNLDRLTIYPERARVSRR